jgi:hypothetical protein
LQDANDVKFLNFFLRSSGLRKSNASKEMEMIIMNINQVLVLVIVVLIAIMGTGLYIEAQPKLNIDPLLKDNKAAQEIAAMGIEVDVEDLGTDGNGYTVCGQTRWYTNNNTVAEVVLDDEVDPNSYEAYAILYHELGHVLAVQHGTENTEAIADDYAASRGYNIVDAYHGVH